MEMLSVKNLSFSFANSSKTLFNNISFHIADGELCLLCGLSGSGKTTLLRLIKKSISPAGFTEGEITSDIDEAKTGYVFQNPESQIVMDNVYDELVFGCENMGMSTELINMRLCEVSAFLGIEDLLYKKCNILSGGEKQLVNLAAILMMEPELILFDEPLSQLDPVSASAFISILTRIHNELGITIIICEHTIDDILCICDKVLYMCHGTLDVYDDKDIFAKKILHTRDSFIYNLPEITRFCADYYPADGSLCHNVKDYRRSYISSIISAEVKKNAYDTDTASLKEIKKAVKRWNHENSKYNPDTNTITKRDFAIKMKNIFFRYEKNSPDVLSGITLEIKMGEIFSFIGNNGAGKSTLLSLFTGFRKPYSGKLYCTGKIAYLPQRTDFAFIKDNYLADLLLLCKNNKIEKTIIDETIDKYPFFSDIKNFFDANPLDLSGGEKQLAGIFKLLLLSPDILVLDEPTKGLDGYTKKRLDNLLSILSTNGMTIILVSHDLPFVYRVSDRCAMLFNGRLLTTDNVNNIFESNRFYTTPVHRAVVPIISHKLGNGDFIE